MVVRKNPRNPTAQDLLLDVFDGNLDIGLDPNTGNV
jgi:hypothetical protein